MLLESMEKRDERRRQEEECRLREDREREEKREDVRLEEWERRESHMKEGQQEHELRLSQQMVVLLEARDRHQHEH